MTQLIFTNQLEFRERVREREIEREKKTLLICSTLSSTHFYRRCLLYTMSTAIWTMNGGSTLGDYELHRILLYFFIIIFFFNCGIAFIIAVHSDYS